MLFSVLAFLAVLGDLGELKTVPSVPVRNALARMHHYRCTGYASTVALAKNAKYRQERQDLLWNIKHIPGIYKKSPEWYHWQYLPDDGVKSFQLSIAL
jgi:hypothetical protein